MQANLILISACVLFYWRLSDPAEKSRLFSQVDPANLLTERKYGVGGDGEFIDAHLKEGLRDGEITAELTAHADPDAGFVCIFYRHLDEL